MTQTTTRPDLRWAFNRNNLPKLPPRDIGPKDIRPKLDKAQALADRLTETRNRVAHIRTVEIKLATAEHESKVAAAMIADKPIPASPVTALTDELAHAEAALPGIFTAGVAAYQEFGNAMLDEIGTVRADAVARLGSALGDLSRVLAAADAALVDVSSEAGIISWTQSFNRNPALNTHLLSMSSGALESIRSEVARLTVLVGAESE